jgi:hypothetical protein
MRTEEIDLRVASVTGPVDEVQLPLTKSNDITERAERSAAPTIAYEKREISQLLSNYAGPTFENSQIQSRSRSLCKA